MQIRRLDTECRRDVERFARFPLALYRDSSLWVPPLLSETRGALNRHTHPFYRHSTADFFLAEGEDRLLGRIAVMHNRNHNAYRGVRTAFFGFFEAVDDRAVAQGLFEAAFAWARARGLDEIIGPRGLLGPDAGGVLVEGFEHRPAMGVPYNPPYYDALITGCGFRKDRDHLSGYLDREHGLPLRFSALAEQIKARRGFRVKSFSSKEEMRRWVPRVGQVHKQAFVNTHEYFPPTDEETALFAETLISVADPRLVKLVLRGDEVIGFLLAYHDLSAGLQKARGQLWPLGWYYLLRERKRTKWVNFNGVGLLPACQGLGANAVLYAEIGKTVQEFGFEHADFVMVDETNLKSRLDMEAIGVQWYKHHRSYRRSL